MGTHPIFESDFDCLTDMFILHLLLVSTCILAESAPKATDKGSKKFDNAELDKWIDENMPSGPTLIGAAVGLVAAPIVLPVLGFGATGITAGSLAAGVQSVLYGGATSGAFAALQSAGVAGVSAVTAGILGSAGAAAGKAYNEYKIKSEKDENKNV